jgi:hypothetical protein
MISKEELDKITEEKTGLSDRLFVGFKIGFREAEKIYLKKIAELEKNNERLKNEIIELIDLGTDQVVTEKIVKLEARIKSARECIDFYSNDDNWIEPWSENADVVDRDNLEGGKRAKEWLKNEGEND